MTKLIIRVSHLVAAGMLLFVLSLSQAPATLASTQIEWAEKLEHSDGGFQRALKPPAWDFPTDFGPHPEYQTEWWYYTGNLEDDNGRPFGFQFTVFRQGLTPQPAGGASAMATTGWRTPQVYSAHFTVSDIQSDQFQHQERFSRGAQGIAGASADPYRVWLNDWQIRALDPEAKNVTLRASTEQMAIDLQLGNNRAPVLQGNGGLSQKGPEAGNASLYYSLIQQPTSGLLRLGDHTYDVHGVSWKDHEIFTNSLSKDTVGWDWFSAQFDDGSALMLYGLRHEDGNLAAESNGLWIPADAKTPVSLSPSDIDQKIISHWRSPHSGATYPAGWEVKIPRLDLVLSVEPMMADQELSTASAIYWEGAVRYQGQQASNSLNGRGYAELTGYADRLDGLLGSK